MPHYNTKYTSAGLSFTEIKKEANVVLYEGTSPTGRKQYELHILKYSNASTYSEDPNQRVIASPASSEWGSFGFTYNTYEGAIERYHQLVATNSRKARFLAERDAIHASQAHLGNIIPESTTRAHTVDALAHTFHPSILVV